MTIEQVLMRSLKTSGGLTRGRGISPSTIAKWVHSMPAASRAIDAMETFGGVACVTSEQHVDLRESDQKRDHADTATFLTWLDRHHPFQRASHLLASPASGVVASAAVNCDDALSVGEASMKAMEGKRFSEIHLQRRNSVRSLASVTKAVKVRGEHVCINPNQLFHRIVCIVRSEEEIAEYLTNELAECPPALFDDCSLQKGNKSSIVTVLDGLAPSGTTHLLMHCTPLTGVIFYIVLFGSSQQPMDISVNNTNSTRRSGMDMPVSCLMDMTLHAQRTQINLAV